MNRNKVIFVLLSGASFLFILFAKRNDYFHYDENVSVDLTCEVVGGKLPLKLSFNQTSYKWRPPLPGVRQFNLSKEVQKENVTYCLPKKENVFQILINIYPDSLFGINRGIYTVGKFKYLTHLKSIFDYWHESANYRNRGRDSERKAKVFLNANEALHLGVKIKGNATRSYPQKSLKLCFREEYGSGKIENDWFSDSLRKYEYLILSTSGNDVVKAAMREPFSQFISKSLNIFTYPWRYSELYINGEYWGLHFVSPRVDAEYLEDILEEKEIYVFEDLLLFYKGEVTLFDDFLTRYKVFDQSVSKSMEKLSKLVSIESLIDYTLIETFANNQDWPTHNFKAFGIKDAPIRFILNDLDLGWGIGKNNEMFQVLKNENSFFSELLGHAMELKEFRMLLLDRYKELAKSTFSVELLVEKLDSLEQEQEPLMPQQIMRWRTHSSVQDWKNEVDVIRVFIKGRHTTYNKELLEFIEYYEHKVQ
jgi:hypothetical protein